MFHFPVMIGDLGGTYSRFALLSGPGELLSPLVNVKTAFYCTPAAAVNAALQSLTTDRPRSLFLGIAGRVESPVVKMTNAAWIVDAGQIGTDFDLKQVVLVNDYVPVAALLPFLAPDRPGELAPLGPSMACGDGIRLALGPGTGLGAAACMPVEGRYWLHPTEAGHVDFGACEADEFVLWPLIERVGGRISAETVLSGPGLVRLHRAAAKRRGEAPTCSTPMAVIAVAKTQQHGAARDAVHLFTSLLGRFAGDLALIFGASGGVFFGSGILPRILGTLEPGTLRQALERKAPFETVLQRTPTFVITLPEPAMVGLARMASAPDRFIFESQTWHPRDERADQPTAASDCASDAPAVPDEHHLE